MNLGPDEARRELLMIWEGDATDSAPLEFFLLALLQSGGVSGVHAWARGFPLDPSRQVEIAEHGPELIRFTRLDLPACVVSGAANADMSWVNVSVERPDGPPADQDARHALFYAIWERVGGTAYEALENEAERAVFLVGLLEAEVMNGGFGQYLSNTDGARLAPTFEVLDMIGAPKLRALLESAVALADGAESYTAAWDDHPDAYCELDGRFYDAPEDLAGLTADRFLELDA